MTRKSLPFETLASLRVRLDQLSPKDPERKELIASTASLYGVSAETVYRALSVFCKLNWGRRALENGASMRICNAYQQVLFL